MIKMLGNLLLFIWLRFRITSYLAAENLALRQQLVVMEQDEQAAEDSDGGSTFLGSPFPNLEPLA